MIAFVIWLIIAVIVGVALMAVVKAALETPALAWLGPYAKLIYALVILLIVLIAVSWFYPPGLPHPWRGLP